jgi:hypothetical protein
MNNKIDYSKLSLPVRGDSWDKIKKFAMLLNAYDLKGSFKQVAEIANNKEIEQMDIQDVHIALFFEYRRYNHFGYDPSKSEMERIYGLVDQLNFKKGNTA